MRGTGSSTPTSAMTAQSDQPSLQGSCAAIRRLVACLKELVVKMVKTSTFLYTKEYADMKAESFTAWRVTAMPSTRISTSTREALRQLAEESGESMQEILEQAVEMYRRQRFLESSNRAFEALRANADAWKTEQAERQAWEITLSDGLEEK